jgi:predicted dienelactone hydrolase
MPDLLRDDPPARAARSARQARPTDGRTLARPTRRAWLAAALALGTAVPMRASALDLELRDPERDRTLPLRLRLPAEGGGLGGPVPWVLYSHGLGGTREGGDVWGEAWRRAGFGVLHVQHPGSDFEAVRGGVRALREAMQPQQLLARAQDVRWLLGEVAARAARGETPWRALDPAAVAVAGHSFGAHTTLAVAGQRYMPARAAARAAAPTAAPTAAVDLADPRPRAFVALSPSLPRDEDADPVRSFGAIARPMLLVTGSLDGDPFGRHADGAPRARVYEGLPPGARGLLWLDGADHATFGGNRERPLRARAGPLARQPGALEAEPRHHALVAAATTLWWRAHLLGDREAAAALRALPGLGAKDRLDLG